MGSKGRHGMMLQLNPPLPVLTPKGEGLACFVIDYGIEHDLIWVCAIATSGECWCINNPDIRFHKNWTFARMTDRTPFKRHE